MGRAEKVLQQVESMLRTGGFFLVLAGGGSLWKACLAAFVCGILAAIPLGILKDRKTNSQYAQLCQEAEELWGMIRGILGLVGIHPRRFVDPLASVSPRQAEGLRDARRLLLAFSWVERWIVVCLTIYAHVLPVRGMVAVFLAGITYRIARWALYRPWFVERLRPDRSLVVPFGGVGMALEMGLSMFLASIGLLPNWSILHALIGLLAGLAISVIVADVTQCHRIRSMNRSLLPSGGGN